MASSILIGHFDHITLQEHHKALASKSVHYLGLTEKTLFIQRKEKLTKQRLSMMHHYSNHRARSLARGQLKCPVQNLAQLPQRVIEGT